MSPNEEMSMGIYKRGRPSKQAPPSAAGEYRWRNRETGAIDYVGETNNLARRRGEHERSDKPVSRETHDFEWQRADGRSTSRTRRAHERETIDKHQPPLNRRGGGGGRRGR